MTLLLEKLSDLLSHQKAKLTVRTYPHQVEDSSSTADTKSHSRYITCATYALWLVMLQTFACFRSYTMFRISTGNYDVSRMKEVKPILGPTFFFLYVFIVLFILLNFFVAILTETYQATVVISAARRHNYHLLDYFREVPDRTISYLFCSIYVLVVKCVNICKRQVSLSVSNLISVDFVVYFIIYFVW